MKVLGGLSGVNDCSVPGADEHSINAASSCAPSWEPRGPEGEAPWIRGRTAGEAVEFIRAECMQCASGDGVRAVITVNGLLPEQTHPG